MHIVSSLIIMFKLVKSCKKVSSMRKNKKNYKKKCSKNFGAIFQSHGGLGQLFGEGF